MAKNHGWFQRFAKRTASWTGSPYAFALAFGTIVTWVVSGPVFGFSDTWQLVINTGTTIITFLMVFLIQNTQNRDSVAIQLKLDELIRATRGAHTVLLDLEELNEKELEALHERYEDIAEHARNRLKHGRSDTNIPNVILDKNPLRKKAAGPAKKPAGAKRSAQRRARKPRPIGS
ncbi:low affinity iron permease family protein [bacterium]|nr:low affinity iron permease family protein [bacterium]